VASIIAGRRTWTRDAKPRPDGAGIVTLMTGCELTLSLRMHRATGSRRTRDEAADKEAEHNNRGQ
jgi:hypothetical protein